jgi:flagellar hook assembly protein FlgD
MLQEPINVSPVLGSLEDHAIPEGERLAFSVEAVDPDGDPVSLEAQLARGEPLETIGAVFIDHGDGNGTSTWTPDFDQAGEYLVTFTVSDGEFEDSETITITVVNANGPPLLAPIGDQAVNEGQTLTLHLTATDPDGDVLTYSASLLPVGASFEPVTGTFSWIPGSDQAGTYTVTFTVSDGELSDEETITITVTDVPLVLTSLSDSPDPFSPNGNGRKDTTAISGTFNHLADWQLQLTSASGTLVRTFSGSGVSVTQGWDGKDETGTRVVDGSYTYTLSGTDVGGSQASGSGTVRLDTLAPTLSGLTDAPDPFSPSTGQTTTISFTVSEAAYVTLRISNATGTLSRTLLTSSLKPRGSQSVIWDGKDGFGVLVPAGVYTYKVWVQDRASNRASPYPATGKVTVQSREGELWKVIGRGAWVTRLHQGASARRLSSKWEHPGRL